MSRIAIALITTLVLLLPALAARAEVVRDLYSAEVPVTDRGSQALAAASREALSQVLVKASGSVDVLQNPAIGAALGNARQQVQQYAYYQGDQAAPGLTVRIEFDGAVINQVLFEAGAPLWTANRPSVLVWMVMEGPGGRQFINHETQPQLAQALVDGFARRGVPVQLPLFDLADSAAISPGEVWSLSSSSLGAASGRYAVQDILAGRVAGLSTGSWIGDWTYLADGPRIDRSVTTPSAEGFIQAGVSLVAEEMAARYAVAPVGGSSRGVTLRVSGVETYADYAGVVSWLEGLELIEHANIERIVDSDIYLRLHAQAGAVQLAAIIELNERLAPLDGPNTETDLAYRWQN